MHSRYGSKRSTLTRPVLPVIHVACDDTRTGVAYFELLKHEVRGAKVVHVVPASKDGAVAADIVELAATPSAQDPNDRSFALVDLDTNPNVAAIQVQAQSKGVIVLFSNPCFEVWTLAHLQSTGEAFLDCNAVLTRLKQKWRDRFGSDLGPKAQARYEKLSALRPVAIANCKARNPSTNQSWSEVWKAVDAILT